MSAPSILAELLAEYGIAPKSQRPGHTEKLRCPKCDGGRTREASLSLAIDADGEGATWKCHRGHCAWAGGGRTASRDGVRRPAPDRRVRPSVAVPAREADKQNRPAELYAFFEARGISAETVDAFGVYTTSRYFPTLGERDAITFPYMVGGKVVNRKYRPPEKSPQLQEKDALPSLFNIDAVTMPDVVWWVEGEPDVMAMAEAGYRQTVSLPNGAGDTLRDENDPRRDDDKRFLPLKTHADLLAKVGKFVLAGDMDGPGQVLREELARRLGRHRCWMVTWPDGCKDAGDVLRQHGQEEVQRALEAAEPYPIDGLQRVRTGMLLDLRAQPAPPLLSTGTRATDAILNLPGEGGRLIVITGIPNHGKSSWALFVAVHLMTAGRRFLVFSPEMEPWSDLVAHCAQIRVGKPFWFREGLPCMTDDEVRRVEAWLQYRLTLLVCDAESQGPTLDWIIERARMSVLRDGVTDLLIDPWNEVDHQRSALSETDYVGRALQRLRSFAARHGVNVWIVAHPTKQQPAKSGGIIEPPGMYEISGSSNWANKADIGITVHNIGPVTEIHLGKSRFTRWGRRGSKATLEFDPTTGRYSSPLSTLVGSST